MAIPNLISISQAQLSLAGSIDPSNPALPMTISAATAAITRFVGRVFSIATYDEIVIPVGGRADYGEPAVANLSYFPINSVTRVSGGRVTALTIVNSDSVTNQIARVAFTFTGDVTLPDLVYTGLTLTTLASGVQTASPITWTTASPYTTVNAVATAINALGNGWVATVAATLGAWPAAELVGAKSVKPGFSPGTSLDVFATDLPDSSVDLAAGILSVSYGSVFGPTGYGYGYWQGGYDEQSDSDSPAGGQQVRVQYSAGWTLIPYDVQQACLIVVKSYLQELETVTTYADETADKWKGTLVDLSEREIPDSAKRILFRYKARVL